MSNSSPSCEESAGSPGSGNSSMKNGSMCRSVLPRPSEK